MASVAHRRDCENQAFSLIFVLASLGSLAGRSGRQVPKTSVRNTDPAPPSPAIRCLLENRPCISRGWRCRRG